MDWQSGLKPAESIHSTSVRAASESGPASAARSKMAARLESPDLSGSDQENRVLLHFR